MKKLFEKWFCKHKWVTHAKKSYRITNAFSGSDYGETEEVIICSECGKIKRIKY